MAEQQVLVFISHTSGMRKHPPGASFVAAAEQAINRIPRAKARHMQHFPAADTTPADYSADEVSKADLFVAVIGFDYGSRVRGDTHRSYTQLEFETATRLRIPRLVFLLDPNAAGLQGLTLEGADPAQLAFRRRLEDSATVAYFSSADELDSKVNAAVVHWMSQRSTTTPPAAPRPLPVASSPGLEAVGCLVPIVLAATIGMAVWTGVAASFPPWAPQPACVNAAIKTVKSSAPGFGQTGAVLDIDLTNDTNEVMTVPSASAAIATGRSGQQYTAKQAFGESSWFQDVDVQPGATRRVRLAVEGPAGTDRLTVSVPGVQGLRLPFLACRLTSRPATVSLTD